MPLSKSHSLSLQKGGHQVSYLSQEAFSMILQLTAVSLYLSCVFALTGLAFSLFTPKSSWSQCVRWEKWKVKSTAERASPTERRVGSEHSSTPYGSDPSALLPSPISHTTLAVHICIQIQPVHSHPGSEVKYFASIKDLALETHFPKQTFEEKSK